MLDYVMNATYASGFLAYGHYATDTLSIGGAKLKDMEFAVAETSLNPRKFKKIPSSCPGEGTLLMLTILVF